MFTKQDLVQQEKYLKIDESGNFILDYDGKLVVIDFHTHMCNVLPVKSINPDTKGKDLKYLTLPSIENIDFSIPYWKKEGTDNKQQGFMSVIRYSANAYKILLDMKNGGTYENCIKSQDKNQIKINVVLPLSNKKFDCSLEALRTVSDYPKRFVAFCSVHPDDPQLREKLFKYKALGAKGCKLKISEIELKNDFRTLINLYRVCYEAELPLLLHTGSPHVEKNCTHNLLWKLLKSTRVEIFGRLLKELPKDFVFIFGHSGVSEYELVAEFMQKYPACYAELSSQSQHSIGYLIDKVGYERLLFGSDWPALPQAITLSRVLLATENNAEAREYILFKNAKRLLNL